MNAGCRHCGLPVAAGQAFCCSGCRAAYDLIGGLGLGRYYERRRLDPGQPPPKPETDADAADPALYVRLGVDGTASLDLMVEGLHCGACVWLIEAVLAREPDVVRARLNMTTRRLALAWRGGAGRAAALIGRVAQLGYRPVPFDPARLAADTGARERALLKALAVAGFATGNVMLLSVAVWAGSAQGMAAGTRDLLHWVSALIAMPAIAYAGRPFFASAWSALAVGRTNMDVPISLAVILTPAVSVVETFTGGAHAYFDSSVMLLFFLLIGRYLDGRARGRARAAAERMTALGAAAVTVLEADGRRRSVPSQDARPGMIVLVPAGGRIGVDGRVVDGASEIDAGFITGESTPLSADAGTRVFAGTLNLSAPIRVEVTAAGPDTLLAEIVRLMEAAEQGRARHVALSDRVARLYSPVVHALALATFAGWLAWGGVGWQPALLTAIAVLIITCPCALALAVPVVQVVAAGRLMRQGILVKSATALERLAAADTVVFDKTGTLTLGRLAAEPGTADAESLALAARMAAASSHPLARALAAAAPDAGAAESVRETPGAGLGLATPEGEIRLGSRRWCGIGDDEDAEGPELWLARPGRAPVRFTFRDEPRADAAVVVAALVDDGFKIELLSGDRAPAVEATARALGIPAWRAGMTPAEKAARLADLAAAGRRVVMVGDGLNDAPALAAAHASMSPAAAADVSRAAADVVFQGQRLAPVREALVVARGADRLVRQNLALAIAYNAVAVPLAVLGWVTPLVAAAAMSASSLAVIANALRLAHGGRRRRSLDSR